MTVQPYLIDFFLGDSKAVQKGEDAIRAPGEYNNPEFTKYVAQELLSEIQKTSNLDEGLCLIHRALEFVKSNRIHQYSNFRRNRGPDQGQVQEASSKVDQ